MWFAVLAFVVWILSALRGTVRRQRMQIDEETEVSDDLRNQNDIKNTLLHAVSHDLKGPLAGILGAMQTIRRAEKLNLTEIEMEDLYGVIEQAGRKAARLVDDLLDLDRLRRGQLQPERAPHRRRRARRPDLPPSWRRCRGIPVRVESDPVMVDIDPAKVERIVENLLNNAARHTPQGTPDPRVVERAARRRHRWSWRMRARACPNEMKDAIFEPFRQGESARGGVGIGLSLVVPVRASCTAATPTSRIATAVAPASWSRCPARSSTFRKPRRSAPSERSRRARPRVGRRR